MTFLLAFWKPIAAVAAVIVLAIAVMAWKHSYDGARREEGRAEVQEKWDMAKAAALKASNEQEQRWIGEVAAREKAEQERDNERAKRTEVAADAAKRLPDRVARVVVPRESVRVLNDAIARSDTAPPAGPAAKPSEKAAAAPEGADSTVGLLTQWGVSCISAYDEARSMVDGWQAFYASLRAAQ